MASSSAASHIFFLRGYFRKLATSSLVPLSVFFFTCQGVYQVISVSRLWYLPNLPLKVSLHRLRSDCKRQLLRYLVGTASTVLSAFSRLVEKYLFRNLKSPKKWMSWLGVCWRFLQASFRNVPVIFQAKQPPLWLISVAYYPAHMLFCNAETDVFCCLGFDGALPSRCLSSFYRESNYLVVLKEKLNLARSRAPMSCQGRGRLASIWLAWYGSRISTFQRA